ncbi:putative chy zinc finger domain-containing protein [Phaeoacremonium minimum UCRPA7]|uniref:Putative chy zinc finger domain-containing protein n=1 Tax=Phaeoacremonium minimum (strain UCR-PA7) TaxID=1286976 RepID=R8BWK4_PHAM7|nr:putative chy zinc finger domain-containing protein [Phaeoacremonium minimum UCRPA7]EOO03684.1 putative chy zinc finger domain-containing protein [Phaeoacremonium minimum UCRPA7]
MISTTAPPVGQSSRRQAVSEAAPSRVVPKPVPKAQTEDARGYQIGQIRKRFSPKESTVENGTTLLVFNLSPSDPDFPFELDSLKCELRVPKSYPKGSQLPSLSVKNKDIPRGFAVNVERGWDRLVQERKGATLLSLTNALDKNLEALLSEQEASTVKLTIYKDTRHLEGVEQDTPAPEPATLAQALPVEPRRRYVPEESFSKEQIATAKERRAQETRQLEARMGRLPHYHKSSDGIIYTLPIEPKRRSDLPSGLQTVKSFQLIVPLLYPLQALRVLLNEVESETAEGVEELFMSKAAEKKDMSLMSHINYLTQNIHVLSKQAQAIIQRETQARAATEKASEPTTQEEQSTQKPAITEGRGQVQVIPRPPEWSYGHESDTDGEESSDLSTSDSEDGGAATLEAMPLSSSLPAQIVERGTAISFPSVELHGIELLQVAIMSLSVKCERCKTINEVGGLKDGAEKNGSCRKCGTAFTVKFRPELVHQNSTRAGFIDVSGCTVADLLPSTFVPTCAKCSTPSQGLVSVRGETTTNVCRECHSRFTFKIPDVRFLAYTAGSGLPLPPTSGPRRRQEKLGLHAGEPLPERGACPHYKKSYRWFRFSCCSKVYPCDKCHDAAEEHINEWANRMICGYCSREQNYAVESCTFCGRSVIGKRGKGFWEGGRGTRDRGLMSRKDKRKYRRIGGGGEATKKP